jgi:eukaryotic-like serine/threonine-protein kinase
MSAPPAERLEGIELDGGWKVRNRATRPPGATGGMNSVCYTVEHLQDKKIAFLKAIDLSASTAFADPLLVLQSMLQSYLHERDVCQHCRDKRMRRVATAIASGQAQVDPGLSGSVPYLIFELADSDVRKFIDAATDFDIAWTLRTLHQLAAGMMQLHRGEVAHLDIKPSNALVYREEGTKLADLGRAVRRGNTAPHESLPIAGDLGYAPPDLLYGRVSPDWNERRLGCDLYLLGSLTVFLFARANMTALISSEMDASHHWRTWRGEFEEVLPYMRDAFNLAIARFAPEVPEKFRTRIVEIVRTLCDPDPRRRGHPINQAAGNSMVHRYSLERYVSELNVLATRAEMNL